MGLALAVALFGMAPAAVPTSPPGHDIVAEGTPLLRELGKPRYAVSRCLLAPLLAANGRTVASNDTPPFKAHDLVLAVDGEALNATSPTALLDILEHREPNAELRLRLSRQGADHDVTTRCSDVRPYYDTLRAGAQAAVARDAGACADRLDAAARLHRLASVWLRLSISCRIDAGRLGGDAMWRADYDLYRQRIAEAEYSAPLLDGLRHAVRLAARDLDNHGQTDLANALRKRYADAVTEHTDMSSTPSRDAD